MKTLKISFIILAIIFLTPSCEDFLSDDGGTSLTTDEIVEGLKTALEIGTDSATSSLKILNGYYGNLEVKIPLPDEAQLVREKIDNMLNSGNSSITQTIITYFDLDQEFENVVLSINRAAEEAAKDAAPIFRDAILNLSISQAIDILNGTVPEITKSTMIEGFDSTAATEYFKIMTYDPLVALYAPKIDSALDVDLGLGFSATDAWTLLTSKYNTALSYINSFPLNLLDLAGTFGLPAAINDDLGVYSTGKALDGLFNMVGKEERKIRKNPFQWISDIIRKVFGSIFMES